jgi:hypothetical protein
MIPSVFSLQYLSILLSYCITFTILHTFVLLVGTKGNEGYYCLEGNASDSCAAHQLLGMAGDLQIRRAEINDVVEFNGLLSSLDGVPLFKAIFGTFNYTNLIEYSHLSLIASHSSNAESAQGFVSISDSPSIDSLSFESSISQLKPFLPVEVELSNNDVAGIAAVCER